jgi:hypothetical protein
MIEIGGEQFKSKTKLFERVQGILHRYAPPTAVPPPDADFLTACLRVANVHYGYPPETPVQWRVEIQKMIGVHRELVFYRPDGTAENPSIRRLSLQKPLKGKQPVDAARQSVLDQILAYRDRVPPRCEACGANGAADRLEVHHEAPAFNSIWLAFLELPDVVEAAMEIVEFRDGKGVMTGYRLADPHHAAFAAFHKQNARLRLLCRACHGDVTYGRV